MINILFANPISLINTNVGPITHPYYTKFGGNQYTGGKGLQQFQVIEPEKAPETCEVVSEASSSDEGDVTPCPSLSTSEKKLQSPASDSLDSLDSDLSGEDTEEAERFRLVYLSIFASGFTLSGVPQKVIQTREKAT